jgi:hypothetical protein
MLNVTIYLLGGVSAVGLTATIDTYAAEQTYYVHAKSLGIRTKFDRWRVADAAADFRCFRQ